jgi:predicted TIM-barrel fold metal-dependent hydrolase
MKIPNKQIVPMVVPNRRAFTQQTAFGLGSILVGYSATASEPNESDNWIDAHVHVWTSDTVRYPIDGRHAPEEMTPLSFTPEELFSECRPAGVSKVVLIQMSFYEADHRFMFDCMTAYPGLFSAVGLIDYRAANLFATMERLAAGGVRGFRLHSHGDAHEWLESQALALLWKTAAEQGWAVCPLINPEEIPIINALCARFPQTTVVVDHFARVGISGRIEPKQLEELCKLSKHPRTHVKTSAFYALGRKQPPYSDLLPMIRTVVDAFGPERLMWASDCPFQVQAPHTYKASLALIHDQADFLSTGDKEWLLRKTADKVFFHS